MPRITIRDATPDDVPLIRALIRELAEYEREPQSAQATDEDLRANLFGAGKGFAPSNSAPPTGTNRGVPSPLAQALIGEIDGVACGLALFFHNYSTWTGKPGVYLEDLFVRPAARGSGLGTALLARVAKFAVDRGCPRLEWLVLDWNESAIGFYKSLGATALDGWTIHRLSGEALSALARTA